MGRGNGSPLEHSARVYQAQGMVSVQAACSFDDAMTLMRFAAEVAETTLDQVADDVINRRVRFG